MLNTLRVISQSVLHRSTRVLVRADFDIAMEKGRIRDDFRMQEVLPTIRFLLTHGCRIRIISHQGRPGGKQVSSLGMKLIAEHLSRMLKKSVVFISDPFDEETIRTYDSCADILFFENIRFWPGEENNSTSFARSIARWGDIYVNEAFANCHRVHASMVALPKILPSFAGFRLEKEVSMFERVMRKPARPVVAILGGVKLETKIPLIRRFLKNADHVLIGGAIANTLFSMQGIHVGRSFIDGEKPIIPQWLHDKKLSIPTDIVVSRGIAASSRSRICGVQDVASNEYIVDIGPKTINRFKKIFADAKIIVWNGPLGYAEISRFAQGTIAIARGIRRLKAFTVIGGGDSVAILHTYKLLGGFTHVSTGGGAMLEFLAGKKLPAIEILKNHS